MDTLPPWEYVQDLFEQRIEWIKQRTEADDYLLFLSEGRSFRDLIAITRPYKSTRTGIKPFHYDNLTVYITELQPSVVVLDIEADDMIAMMHNEDTIVCSRDKDFRQLKGWLYGWELGKQPEYKEFLDNEVGYLELVKGRANKLGGRGFAYFCGQCLTGDPVDTIPGLPSVGPVAAYNHLCYCISIPQYWQCVKDVYKEVMGNEWETYLIEQASLLWLRRDDNTPMWRNL